MIGIGKGSLTRLVEKVNLLSTPLAYDNDFFMKNIVHESYTDIINNEKLSKFIMAGARNGGNRVDLTRLHGVAPDQMRVLTQEGLVNDSVDLVLRIAEINMEIIMATAAGDVDIFTPEGSEEILAGKLARYKVDKSLVEGFASLLELSNIPDIRQAVTSDAVDVSRMWSLRQKKIAAQFRKWLREANPQNGRELERAYVQVLGKTNLADSLPVRTIRFAITSVAGINPVVGLIVGAVDNFFVDRWLSGYSPKLLLDELSKLFKSKNAT